MVQTKLYSGGQQSNRAGYYLSEQVKGLIEKNGDIFICVVYNEITYKENSKNKNAKIILNEDNKRNIMFLSDLKYFLQNEIKS